MFIELLDTLRCPADHPQIPLVATIIQRDGRMVTDGVLGCPTCRSEYPIRDGVVWFAAKHGEQPDGASVRYGPDGALRAGAYVGAVDGATVALVGDWARYASELAELAGVRVYAVNPRGAVAEDSDRVGTLYCDRRLPLADSALRGLAIDEPDWSSGDLELAARALASSGRLAAPASSPIPRPIAEIARDDDFWVGEKQGPLVSLHRR